MRLHDLSIEEALDKHLHSTNHPLKVVGIMGGHEMRREVLVVSTNIVTGQVNAVSINGNVQLDLFYVASSSTGRFFDQYWVAKPNTHQVLVTPSSNNIVDLGDSLCGFEMSWNKLVIFPGVTNIGNTLSTEDIRQYFTPVFERFYKGKDLGLNIKNLTPESLLPRDALGSSMNAMGIFIKITKITATTTNITLELTGEQKKKAEFIFGKNLNLIEALALKTEGQANTNELTKPKLNSPRQP